MGIEIIEHLAGRIGVRFAGTSSEEEGARYLLEQFKGLGLETELEWFRFLGWELLEQASLRITGPVEERIPCFACVYSPSTPEGSLELPLRKIGKMSILRGMDCNRYAMVDPETGEHRAHIISRLDGPGCAMTLPDVRLTLPTVVVGGDEARALERAAEEHPELSASLSLASAFKPDARSCNVVARLPGSNPEKRIIVTSHHDTLYNSPGAVDNASGTQAVYELARRLSQQPISKDIEFVVFGAEEYMLLGAKYHARLMEETGALKHVEAIVNLDMLACNKPDWINLTCDEMQFKVRVARAFERLGVFERYGDVRWEQPPWETSDHAPFTEANIPTLFVSYEGQKYPHLHLPTDTIDKVDTDLLGVSTSFLYEILNDMVRAA